MANKVYSTNVMRVYIDDAGTLLIRLRCKDWTPTEKWHTVAFGVPGQNSFLAIALTCITSGLPAEAGLDEGDQAEFAPLKRLEIVRP
jgi:hypothetical protein